MNRVIGFVQHGEGKCSVKGRGGIALLNGIWPTFVVSSLLLFLSSGVYGDDWESVDRSTLHTLHSFSVAEFLRGSSQNGIECRMLELVHSVDGDEERSVRPDDLALAEKRIERIASEVLVRFGHTPDPRIHSGVLLVDGSYLVGRISEIKKDRISVEGGWIQGEVPRSMIRSVLFAVPSDGGALEEAVWNSTTAEGREDILVEISGDRWNGLLLSKQVGSPRVDTELVFQVEGQLRRFDERQIRMLVFSPRLTSMVAFQQQEATCIGLSDGSFLRVASWDTNEHGDFSAELICGYSTKVLGVGVQGKDGVEFGQIVSMIAPERIPGVTRFGDLALLRLRRLPLVGPPETEKPERREIVPLRGVRLNQAAFWGALQMQQASQLVIGSSGDKILDGKTPGRLRGSCWVSSENLQGPPSLNPVGARCRVDVVVPSGAIEALWEELVPEITGGSLGEPSGRKWIDIEVPPGRALILSVDRHWSNAPPLHVVWEDMVLAVSKARAEAVGEND